MTDLVHLIHDKWHRKEPAAARDIAEVEQALALPFPHDYIELLMWSNGGEARLGTAYFAIWPIQNVLARNVSASIFTYMTNQFVGIGTNGGAELYALDYTMGAPPTLAMVPLGDLDPDSKCTIAPSLTLGMAKALAGAFDDGAYQTPEGGTLTEELLGIRMAHLRARANEAWRRKDYQSVVTLLEPMRDHLTDLELKKLCFSRSRV